MSDLMDNQNQDEINKIKAKIMYDELIVKYDCIKHDDKEENVIKKIIELNFDEEKIKKYYVLPHSIIDELYNSNSIGCANFDEEDMIKKLREFNCDEKKILEWIENIIINGEE